MGESPNIVKIGGQVDTDTLVHIATVQGLVQRVLYPAEGNRKVITEPFNRVVCSYLAGELDPSSRQKTLIYCVNDVHADLVVKEMKDAFAGRYGVVEDDAVMKITGAADKPLELIRRYKNERTPNVAVTVDLLTTGIDVPEICNLVFLRRVSSRILFEQMLGRATRLCEAIGKEVFRIFDAVRIYEALQSVSSMLPVAVNPYFSFAQLTQELATVQHDKERELVRDQFIAKLQRKQHHLGEAQRQDFESQAGMPPDAFINRRTTPGPGHLQRFLVVRPSNFLKPTAMTQYSHHWCEKFRVNRSPVVSAKSPWANALAALASIIKNRPELGFESGPSEMAITS